MAIWPVTIPAAPQQSFVLFTDGFSHYDTPSQKYSDTGGTHEIEEYAGTWNNMRDDFPLEESWLYQQRKNALFFDGAYSPGDSLPYVEMDLDQNDLSQQTGTRDLRKRMVQVSFNLKSTAFSGTPFLQLLDSSRNVVAGFALTAEGIPVTYHLGDYANIRFAGGGTQYCPTGHWINIRVGIGFAINDDPTAGVNGTIGLRVDVNQHKALAGFGNFYDYDPTGLKIQYIRISTAGEDTYISDLIAFVTGLVNENNNIHWLEPKSTVGVPEGPFFAEWFGIEGDVDDVAGYPPDVSETITINDTCIPSAQYYFFVDAENLRLDREPEHIAGFGFTPQERALEISYVGTPGGLVVTQPEFDGLVWQTFGTVQANALSKGGNAAHGCFLPPDHPAWDRYFFSRGPGQQSPYGMFDGDSNFIWHEDRGNWHFDITQICHWHRWIRRLWTPIVFNMCAPGVCGMEIPSS